MLYFARKRISQKNQSDLTCTYVGFNSFPVFFMRSFILNPYIYDTCNQLSRIFALRGTRGLEFGLDCRRWPIKNRIRSIVKHLPNNFTTHLSAPSVFDFYKGWNSAFIKKKMVKIPPVDISFICRDSYLPSDE